MIIFKITFLNFDGSIQSKIIQTYGLENLFNDIINNGITEQSVLEIKKMPNLNYN